MIDWTGLVTIFATFFVVAASPGPATLAVSTVSAAWGRQRGMLFGAGFALGLGFWGLVAARGLGAILQTTAHLFVLLKVAGGIYLLWLAYGSARAAMRMGDVGDGADDHAPKNSGRWFARGLALNLSNPKAVVAWMAALSVGLGAEDGMLSLIIATIGCALIGLLIYAAYAAAFSLSSVMFGYARFRRGIDSTVAALFAVAGLALLRSAFTRAPATP
jgi:threonine/homoserine/homoserine lactone efflux protein